MLTRWIAALVAVAAMTAPAAAADNPHMFQALPAGSCGTPLAATGKPLTLKAPLDETTRAGLMAGLFLTVHDLSSESVADADVSAMAACPLARFGADDVVWTIHSGRGSAPLRLISAPSREDHFMLLKGPALTDAAEWSRSRRGLPLASAPPIYYLVGVAEEEKHFLIQAYDGPPAMERLAEDLAAILENRASYLALHEQAGGAVNLLIEAAGPRAELFRPGDLKDGAFAALHFADGRLVTDGEDGALVMRGSSFACRPQYGSFTRTAVYVLDASEDAPTLGCGAGTDESWMTLYPNYAPDDSGDKRYAAEQIRAAEQGTGVSRKIGNLPSGRQSAYQAGRVWVDKDGRMQLMIFMRRGDYLYELHQTHTAKELEPASQALQALVEQVDAAGAPDPGSVEGWRAKR